MKNIPIKNIPRTLNIGLAARASGVSAKMIRHYESIGIIPKPIRSDSGYRLYTTNDIHTLQFVKRARNLGFSTVEIKRLVGLWRNKTRASAEVKTMANQHVKELEAKIVELQEMRDALKNLARRCHGDQRPECPIIDELANCGH